MAVIEVPTGWTATADSENVSGEDGSAGNVLDADTGTIWHTQYVPSVGINLPHWIAIDMQLNKTVSGLVYLPRLTGENGTIGQYEIHVSDDGVDWGSAVASGTWTGTNEKTVNFSNVDARHVRMDQITEINGNQWGSGAEINILGADGNALPRTSLSLTGKVPSIDVGSYASAGKGTLTVTGHVPLVTVSIFVLPSNAVLSLSGKIPTRSMETSIGVESGALSLSGKVPAMFVGISIGVGSGTLSLTGNALTLNNPGKNAHSRRTFNSKPRGVTFGVKSG